MFSFLESFMALSLKKYLSLSLALVVPATSFALPIDWHGAFGVDSSIISNYRRVKSKTDQSAINDGTQEVGLDVGAKNSATWQSYVFKLSPTMIINDAATFKAELTTGYAYGGFLGDSAQSNQADNNNIPTAYYSKASGSSVNIKKAYLELYSDTATYQIGRHTYNWGLGAIYNEGASAWDRHSSSRDGITMKLKIGNFLVNPYWSKISNSGLTDATNAKELGIGLLYDNPERDIAFGILYGVRSSSANNTFFKSSIETASKSVGESSVKITDIYLKKVWGNFDVALEVPLMSGDLGYANNSTTNKTKYSAKAILLQSNYRLNDTWTFGLDGGQVDGHDGSSSQFSALYLNPNFQVANLLFRYNTSAIGTAGQTDSVYDSYVTNAFYLKLRSSYATEKWIFDTAIIHAKALEAATAGKASFNHTKNKIFAATTTQADDLGTEIDVNATYKWNNEISVGGGFGYLMTGDYFSYTNSTTVTNQAENSIFLQINTSVTF